MSLYPSIKSNYWYNFFRWHFTTTWAIGIFLCSRLIFSHSKGSSTWLRNITKAFNLAGCPHRMIASHLLSSACVLSKSMRFKKGSSVDEHGSCKIDYIASLSSCVIEPDLPSKSRIRWNMIKFVLLIEFAFPSSFQLFPNVILLLCKSQVAFPQPRQEK